VPVSSFVLTVQEVRRTAQYAQPTESLHLFAHVLIKQFNEMRQQHCVAPSAVPLALTPRIIVLLALRTE